MGFLIFSIPILIAFLVLALIHITLSTLSLVFGIVALVGDRGRRAGIAGIVLTALTNVGVTTVLTIGLRSGG